MPDVSFSFAGQRLAAFLSRRLWTRTSSKALLVGRAPAPVLLASNAEDDLVKVPFVAAAGGSPTDAVGEFLAEFQAPLPDRLVGNRVPRAASISSTIRKLNGYRKYSQTA